MGDPLTKVVLTLVQLYIGDKTDKQFAGVPNSKTIKSIVGDDFICLCKNKNVLTYITYLT